MTRKYKWRGICYTTSRLGQMRRQPSELLQPARASAQSLESHHTAVNDELGAQHVSGFGRCQIEYPCGDFLRCAKPFYRDLALNPIFSLLDCFLRSIAQER